MRRVSAFRGCPVSPTPTSFRVRTTDLPQTRVSGCRLKASLAPHQSSGLTSHPRFLPSCRSPGCEHARGGEGLLHAAGCDWLLSAERHPLQAEIYQKRDESGRGEVLPVSPATLCSALGNIWSLPFDMWKFHAPINCCWKKNKKTPSLIRSLSTLSSERACEALTLPVLYWIVSQESGVHSPFL